MSCSCVVQPGPKPEPLLQVSAYGFMTPDYRNYSDHYYDTSYRPVGFFINHDLRMEMTLWQKLHELHLMQLYMHK